MQDVFDLGTGSAGVMDHMVGTLCTSDLVTTRSTVDLTLPSKPSFSATQIDDKHFYFHLPTPETSISLGAYIRERFRNTSDITANRIINLLWEIDYNLDREIGSSHIIFTTASSRGEGWNGSPESKADFRSERKYLEYIADIDGALVVVEAIAIAMENGIKLKELERDREYSSRGSRIFSEAKRAGIDESVAALLRGLSDGYIQLFKGYLFLNSWGALSDSFEKSLRRKGWSLGSVSGFDAEERTNSGQIYYSRRYHRLSDPSPCWRY